MGNAALIDQSRDASRHDFLALEQKCKRGYFFQNQEELEQVLRQAIIHNFLDVLEILVVSGNMFKVCPIHMAATFGNIEALELLLSAGFPGDSKNREGKTPLHCACSSLSTDSVLCVSLLLIHYPNSIRVFDNDGYTPAHIAAIAENIPALQSMKDQKIVLNSLLDSNGYKLLDIARSKKKQKSIEFLLNNINNNTIASSSKSANLVTGRQDQVSQERIMAVWEKFFENAFLRSGLTADDLEDDLNIKHQPRREKSQKSQKSSKLSKKSRNETKDDYFSYRNDFFVVEDDNDLDRFMFNCDSKSQKSKTPIIESTNYSSLETDHIFSWLMNIIVLRNDPSYDSVAAYIVIDKYIGIQRWIQTFLDEMYYAGLQYPFLLATAEEVANWPLPQSLEEMIQYGWAAFYDVNSNYCMWINVVSGCQETYLPLGATESIEWLNYYGLQPYAYDDSSLSIWIEADQSVAMSWIMVVMEYDEECTESCVTEYFLNTITSDTMWEPPSTWEYLVNSWSGWYLCCMESNIGARFWYDPSIGESQWIEV